MWSLALPQGTPPPASVAAASGALAGWGWTRVHPRQPVSPSPVVMDDLDLRWAWQRRDGGMGRGERMLWPEV